MASPLEMLRQITDVDADLENRLRQLMVEVTFRRGATITGQSALSTSAFYIKSGSARVFYLMGGKEKTFSFSFEDEYIMLSRHLINQRDTTMTIQFLEPTRVITLRPETIRETMLERSGNINLPEAMMFINLALHQYALYLEERLIQFQQASARERYLWATKRYPRLLEVANGTQLASFLGLTRETLYRLRSGRY